jgi:hypothetical protein
MSLLSSLSLPQIATVARRTALAVLILGTLALVGLVVAGYPLAGLGFVLGLAMGLWNMRMISRATARVAASEREDKRRPLAMNTLGRLAVISIVALSLAFFVRQLGFGTLVGLAVFQFALLGNVVMAMLRDPLLKPIRSGEGES